jgi:hypothetical protein
MQYISDFITVIKYLTPRYEGGVRVKIMVFNVTSNNISAISWRSVLLVPGENHHNVVLSTHCLERDSSPKFYSGDMH